MSYPRIFVFPRKNKLDTPNPDLTNESNTSVRSGHRQCLQESVRPSPYGALDDAASQGFRGGIRAAGALAVEPKVSEDMALHGGRSKVGNIGDGHLFSAFDIRKHAECS
jgi:hypothetical protein